MVILSEYNGVIGVVLNQQLFYGSYQGFFKYIAMNTLSFNDQQRQLDTLTALTNHPLSCVWITTATQLQHVIN